MWHWVELGHDDGLKASGALGCASGGRETCQWSRPGPTQGRPRSASQLSHCPLLILARPFHLTTATPTTTIKPTTTTQQGQGRPRSCPTIPCPLLILARPLTPVVSVRCPQCNISLLCFSLENHETILLENILDTCFQTRLSSTNLFSAGLHTLKTFPGV